MKLFCTTFLILSYTGVFCQIAIGKSTISSPSVLLEFGNEPRGLILPWVDTTQGMTDAVPGTIAFDLSNHKVKYLRGGSTPGWVDLSVDDTGIADASSQSSRYDIASAKVIMGASMTQAPGILVLESSNRALILPKMENPHLNIISPSPGMIAYDSLHKQLAIFNGNVWTFWTYSN